MAEIIKVTPQELINAKNQIEGLANDYKTEYIKLLQIAEETTTQWNGKDNEAFRTQVNGFRDNFEKMTKLMNDYALFLNTTAERYRSIQEDIAIAAKNLQN